MWVWTSWLNPRAHPSVLLKICQETSASMAAWCWSCDQAMGLSRRLLPDCWFCSIKCTEDLTHTSVDHWRGRSCRVLLEVAIPVARSLNAGFLGVAGFSLFRLTAFLQKYVPGARLVEDNSMEVCFQLPESAAKQGHMTRLFAELEKVHGALGISSYGISDTSLEEVSFFLSAFCWGRGGGGDSVCVEIGGKDSCNFVCVYSSCTNM